LIEKRADIEARDTEGFRPLHFAAEAGHLEVVESLLRRGATMNVKVDIN
jgi:ankyrin repeat protein